MQASTCTDWDDTTTCNAPREACVDTAEPAVCVEQCTDVCDPAVDASQCSGTIIQGCELSGTTGCYEWVDQLDCNTNSQVCDNTVNPAVCVDHCTNECDTIDAVQCNALASAIEKCTVGADGCNDWVVDTDCSANGNVCYAGSGEPKCVTPCTNECDTVDATQCNGTDIETCQLNANDGCNDWIVTSTCSGATPVCDDSTGSAVCVCADACDPASDADRCAANGTDIESCLVDTDGCYDWLVASTCADPTPACDDSGGPAQCVCADECAIGDPNRCDAGGIWIQTCQVGTDGCNDWVDVTDCSSGGTSTDICENGACVATCTDECTAPADNQCVANVPQNCIMQADGCTDLIVGTDCGAGTCIIDGSGAAICQAGCTEVINQPVGAGGSGLVSQELVDTTLSAFMADDFTLAAATDISMMKFSGFFGDALVYENAGALHFEIYADNAGVPGGVPTVDSPVWGMSVAPNDAQLTIVGGDIVVNLATPASLAAGTYWISFWVTTGTDEFHYWLMADTVNGAEAMLVNPGEGFGIGTDWVTMTSIDVTELDTAFGLWSGPACCVDLCPSDGATMCNGNDIWLCTGQTNGCLGWQVDSTCSDPTPFCDDSSGSAVCTGAIQCGGDDLGNATGTPVVTGDNTGATDDFLGTCGISSGGLDVCYNWTAPSTGLFVFDTEGSAGLTDTVLYMYEGITEIGCSEDDGTVYLSTFMANVTVDQHYVIVVDGYSASSFGAFNLNIEPIANEDICDDFADNDFDELADCSDPTDCQAGASCVPGAGAVGVVCTAHTDCNATATDPACLPDADGWGNGYCSEWCWPGTDDCPAGSLCMDFGYPQRGLCLDECDPAAPDCRADIWVDSDTGFNCSYVCTDLGGGQGICQPQCAPACTATDLGTFDGTAINLSAQDNCTGSAVYSGSGCADTGWSSAGYELLYQIVVHDGVTVNVTMTSGPSFDEYLWVTTDCGDVAGDQCVAGADSTAGSGETLSFTNSTGADVTYFIVADAYGADNCGVFVLDIQ